jgi:chromosome segregation ATPase
VSSDCYDFRKNIESCEARNLNLGGNIRSAEINVKDREENLYGCKKDIEHLSYTNQNMRTDLNDYLAEKEAMDRHSRILLGQNDDLTKELERFVNTDEVLRQQLDRRGRVIDMQDKNVREIGFSTSKVYEARSRSPGKRYQPSSSYAMHTTAATYTPAQMDRTASPPRNYSYTN